MAKALSTSSEINNKKKNKRISNDKDCVSKVANDKYTADCIDNITTLDGIQAVIDSLPAYVLIIDENHQIIAANKSLRNKIEAKEDIIIGSYCPMIMHETNEPVKECPLEKSIENKKPVEIEIFDDKSERWLNSAVYPMNISTDNGLKLFLHIVFDITDEKSAKEEQLKLDRRIQLLLDSTDEGIYGLDKNGNCIFANKASERITGYTIEEILNRNINKVFRCREKENPENIDCSSQPTNCFQNSSGVRVVGEELWRKDGSVLPIEYSASPVIENGKIEGSVVTFTDISDRTMMEDWLRESEERFRAIVEQSKDGIIMESKEGEIILYNDSAKRIFGYSFKEVNKEGLFSLIIPDNSKRLEIKEKIMEAIEGKIPFIDLQFERKDKKKAWASFSVTPLRIGDTRFNLAVVTDITARKEAEEMINYMAFYDVVTDLPNKTLLLDRLSLAIASVRQENKPLAVLYIGLDNYKTIVDTLGHELGEELLREAVHRMLKAISNEKTLASLGNGEFVVLMPNIDHAEESARFAAIINEALKPVFKLGDHEIHISASTGISLCPEDSNDSQTLLENADAALSRAKEKGIGGFEFYENSMNIRSSKRLSMEGKLHNALDNNELMLYYQPQIDAKTSRINGLEALLRWQSPELGFIRPLEFIGIAEDIGLIIPIGEWVIRSACKQNKEWQLKGFPPVRIGVNISARQFKNKLLIDDVRNIINETKLDPSLLEIEITESMMMEDIDLAIRTLKQFKDLGIKVAVDDFGTGYSSLAYLKRFPVDRIKIDKLFVDSLNLTENDEEIVHSIISIAHALKLSVVAEGVEKKEQLEILQSLKCDEIQGFLFCKPLPATGIESLFLNDGRLCA